MVPRCQIVVTVAHLAHGACSRVTRKAHRVLPFNIMATHTALDVTPSFLRMQSSAAPCTQGRESCHHVRCGLKQSLGHVPPCFVALGTEGLRLVAGRTFRLPRPCINPMSEPVVQLMDGLQDHLSGGVFR
jgi:hypothetical protein